MWSVSFTILLLDFFVICVTIGAQGTAEGVKGGMS